MDKIFTIVCVREKIKSAYAGNYYVKFHGLEDDVVGGTDFFYGILREFHGEDDKGVHVLIEISKDLWEHCRRTYPADHELVREDYLTVITPLAGSASANHFFAPNGEEGKAGAAAPRVD